MFGIITVYRLADIVKGGNGVNIKMLVDVMFTSHYRLCTIAFLYVSCRDY